MLETEVAILTERLEASETRLKVQQTRSPTGSMEAAAALESKVRLPFAWGL